MSAESRFLLAATHDCMTYPTIQQRLDAVRADIQQHEHAYGRESGSTHLLAVSKTKPVAAIREAIEAGQRRFGENYLDEALEKIREIGRQAPDASALEWHFIGAIQSRKARDIALNFDWVHGVDRIKVAERLSRARIAGGLDPLHICLQVALDDQPGKAGVAPPALAELALAVAELPGLQLRGLMAIPAPRDALAEQRKVFARLNSLLSELKAPYPDMDTLSCGMTGDLEAAVAEGSTIVRIGTAVFGARERKSAAQSSTTP